MNPHLARAASALAALGLLFAVCTPRAPAAATGGDFRTLSGSVRLPDATGLAIGPARIVREALTAGESSAPMSVSVALAMRNFPELQARVAAGGRVSDAEMEARYLPLRSDYDRVSAWLASQGLSPVKPDRIHMTLFAVGRVSDVAQAFGVRFARVAVPEGEFSSAIDEPRVPAEFAPAVLGVGGLQPQFRPRHSQAKVLSPRDAVGGFIYATPNNIAAAYNIPASETGAGQTIAVIGQGPVVLSDATAFWTAINSPQSAANVTSINANSGAGNPVSGSSFEAAIDVQWAGAIAPGAAIRFYYADSFYTALAQVIDDLPSYPKMSVISISFGNSEAGDGNAELMTGAQAFAYFAANGISVLASSGDSGSNPSGNIGPGNYSATSALEVSYPSTDPNVTAVGGTTVEFTGTFAYAGEVVWNEISTTQSATGGGISSYFPKPSWQTGGSLLAGQSMRCVPDVAAISNANLQNVNIGAGFQPANGTVGALIYQNGAGEAVDGTSLSCPVFAAITVLINQARAAAGLGPIGLLNPPLYALQGTQAFNDVTSGTNGAYNAGTGYDLCTGLGTPNAANLIASLANPGGPAPSHRLVNLSTRAQVQLGSDIAIVGFVINGPAGISKQVLVRAVGPALTSFGVTGVLAQPVLGVYDSAQTLVASNQGWGTALTAGTSSLPVSFRLSSAADMSSVGAFALTSGSADCAMILTLPPGSYTAKVSGAGSTTGVALAEVYEIDTSVPQVLVNISARCFVGTNANVAISGFVVGGNQPAKLVIRGVGPALTGFGLTGVVAQPSVALYDSAQALIVSDTGWGSPLVSGASKVQATYRLATAADMTSVGAFPLSAGSLDSAMYVILPPGQYTAQVSGANGTTGTALAEVYEVTTP